MSNWIPITINTLYEAKIALIVDLCDQLLLKDGQPGRVAGIIQGVVDEVRRKVESNRANRIDANLATVPKGLKNLVVRRVIWSLKDALEEAPTEIEKINFDKDEQDLKAIAAGKDVVDQADTPIPIQIEGAPAVAVIRPGERPGGRQCELGDQRHPFADI